MERLAPPIETVTLLEIAGIMGNVLRVQQKMLKLEEQQTPLGVTEPMEPLTITSDRRHIEAHYGPWFSVLIDNDGPKDVWCIVNTEKSFDPHLVRVGRTYTVTMGRPLIKDVLLYCEAGETASVRVVGTR